MKTVKKCLFLFLFAAVSSQLFGMQDSSRSEEQASQEGEKKAVSLKKLFSERPDARATLIFTPGFPFTSRSIAPGLELTPGGTLLAVKQIAEEPIKRKRDAVFSKLGISSVSWEKIAPKLVALLKKQQETGEKTE